jgi:acyl-CoA synthetase (AMP-forming)/AMP-acid ligase II
MSLLAEMDQYRAALAAPGQPFEMVDGVHNGGAVKLYKNVPPNLSYFIAGATKYADRTFLVHGARRLTFADALGQASGLAAVLREQYHVGNDVRVAIAMRNCPDWAIAFLAVLLAGGTTVLINSRGAPDEIIYGLLDTDCALVICDQRRDQAIRSAGGFKGRRIIADDAGALFDESGAPLTITPGTPTPSAAQPDDPAIIMFTSGTTGRSRGAVQTHRCIVFFLFSMMHSGMAHLTRIARAAGVDFQTMAAQAPQYTALMIFPLFHLSGSSATLLNAIVGGGKLVFMDRWDAAQALALIPRERVTVLSGPPSALWDVLNAPAFKTTDLSTVSTIASGGQATPVPLLRALSEAFPRAMLGGGYGATENGGSITSASGPEWILNPRGSGRVVPGMEIQIRDEDGKELPIGTPGEIWTRGALTMQGYWNKPDANAEIFRDGWMRMGDVGYLNEDRYIFIVDRKKDMVISSGENIYCAELERVFEEHPDLFEVAAFGVPDDRTGERVILAALALPGRRVAAEQVIDFGRNKLAAYKLPSEIVFHAAPFPRTHIGKINKRALRGLYLGELSGDQNALPE